MASLVDAPVCCTLLCVAISRATIGARPRVDPDGQLACERCGRRLNKVKHHRPHGIGRACAPRCNPIKRHSDDAHASVRADSASSSSATASTSVVDRPEKRVRRAKSDPGEQTAVTTTLFTARMAALEAAAATASSGSQQ